MVVADRESGCRVLSRQGGEPGKNPVVSAKMRNGPWAGESAWLPLRDVSYGGSDTFCFFLSEAFQLGDVTV